MTHFTSPSTTRSKRIRIHLLRTSIGILDFAQSNQDISFSQHSSSTRSFKLHNLFRSQGRVDQSRNQPFPSSIQFNWKWTYSLETLGKSGLGCLTSLCPCPCPFPFPSLDAVGSGVEAFCSCFGSSFFGAASSFFSDSDVEAEGVELPSGPRSLGTSIEDRSSPSSARMAIICPTGILLLPSWTWVVSFLPN